MGVHAAGTGSSWNKDSPDVDQPHGLDYRELQDIRIGVRKRIAKQHETFADSTVGGEHLPGGCRILGIVDSTADLTKAAGDASIDVTTGRFIGRGLMYDQTSNVLWCMTNIDGTTSGDPYALKWSPKSVCLGADFTWGGHHLFDASCDFSDVALTGDFSTSKKIICLTQYQ